MTVLFFISYLQNHSEKISDKNPSGPFSDGNIILTDAIQTPYFNGASLKVATLCGMG
jgi:hypothetical protein